MYTEIIPDELLDKDNYVALLLIEAHSELCSKLTQKHGDILNELKLLNKRYLSLFKKLTTISQFEYYVCYVSNVEQLIYLQINKLPHLLAFCKGNEFLNCCEVDYELWEQKIKQAQQSQLM